VSLSVEVIAAAQRSAAASERARLARELHDSLAQTLRGVSFAALALPSSLRRQPALAEQLASTVSQGAEAAAREARQLVTGLRLDSPDRDFDESINVLCRRWAESSRVPTRVVAAPIEPAVAVRYELTRILHEALQNIEAHAHAGRVDVRLVRSGPDVELTVRDDGVGFPTPDDLGALRSGGHYGIVGMSERAKAVHGSLTVTSARGAGTIVTVRVPVSGARHPGDAAITEFAT
jgi:signal transduction histidine kinase